LPPGNQVFRLSLHLASICALSRTISALPKGEYWDSPNSTMLHLYGYVKAAVTGESPKTEKKAGPQRAPRSTAFFSVFGDSPVTAAFT
jgi:hypothetical protein